MWFRSNVSTIPAIGHAVLSTSGGQAEVMYYYPYGESRVDSGSVSVSHKYTSHDLDGETGLYYYGARYYDPELGRFISPDSIVPDPANPQALNRYSYVLNNPLKYTDPTGHSWFTEAVDWLQDQINEANEVVDAVLQFLGLDDVNVGGEGNNAFGLGADSNGDVYAWAGNPDTGEIYRGNPIFNVGDALGGGGGGYTYAFGSGGGGYGPVFRVTLGADAGGAEYINPTGGRMRGCDVGCGYWKANRDGGRKHWGIDIVSKPGQNVAAPFAGRAIDLKKYSSSSCLTWGNCVGIAGKNHFAIMRYIKPSASVTAAGKRGLRVNAGQNIGSALDIRQNYGNKMTNHVHLELYTYSPWEKIDPTPFIFGK